MLALTHIELTKVIYRGKETTFLQYETVLPFFEGVKISWVDESIFLLICSHEVQQTVLGIGKIKIKKAIQPIIM